MEYPLKTSQRTFAGCVSAAALLCCFGCTSASQITVCKAAGVTRVFTFNGADCSYELTEKVDAKKFQHPAAECDRIIAFSAPNFDCQKVK